jgi:hypothetical protein
MTVQATPQERQGLFDPLWKGARDQLLSWFGIVGAAITFVSNSEGLFKLTYWLSQLAQHWIDITSFIWRSLFFLPHIEPFDAQVLNAIGFILLNVFLSMRRKTIPTRWQTRASALLAAIVLTIIFQEGFARAASATPSNGALIPGPIGFAEAWLIPVWEAYIVPYELLFSPWERHSPASVVAAVWIYGLIIFWLGWGIRGGARRLVQIGASALSLIILASAYIAIAVREWESSSFTAMIVVPISLVLLGIPSIAALNLLSHFSPLHFDLAVFQKRLWQIIVAIAVVLLADRSWLVVQKVASLAGIGS